MRRVFLLEKSTRPAKKYQVTDLKTGKKVYFGATGYSDFNIHHDTERQKRYINRHSARENWKKSGIDTPGFWSRWILWNKPGLLSSIRDTENRFNIKIWQSEQRGGSRTVTDLSDLELATIFEQLDIKSIRNFLKAYPEIKTLLYRGNGDKVKPMFLTQRVIWKKIFTELGIPTSSPFFTAFYKTIEKKSPTMNLRGLGLKTTTLPPEIGDLVFLKSLNLSANGLTTLPKEIGNLVNLRGLNLSNNALRRLPDEIGNLENLERLNLSNNKNLMTLPDTIHNLSKLKQLDLDGTLIA